MRKFIISMALLMCAILPAFCQDNGAEQSAAIPTPPGASVTTEMSLSKDQIIAQMDLLIGMIPNKEAAEKIDADKLKEALSTLKFVDYVDMNVPSGFSNEGIISFFEDQVSGRRIIYSVDDKTKTGLIMIATLDGGYFVAVAKPNDPKAKTGKIQAARLFGFPSIRLAVEAVFPLIDSLAPKIAAVDAKPAHKAAPRRTNK